MEYDAMVRKLRELNSKRRISEAWRIPTLKEFQDEVKKGHRPFSKPGDAEVISSGMGTAGGAYMYWTSSTQKEEGFDRGVLFHGTHCLNGTIYHGEPAILVCVRSRS